jgi:hypothetical protein
MDLQFLRFYELLGVLVVAGLGCRDFVDFLQLQGHQERDNMKG